MFYRVIVHRDHDVFSFDFSHITKVVDFCFLLPDQYQVLVLDNFDDSLDVTYAIHQKVYRDVEMKKD